MATHGVTFFITSRGKFISFDWRTNNEWQMHGRTALLLELMIRKVHNLLPKPSLNCRYFGKHVNMTVNFIHIWKGSIHVCIVCDVSHRFVEVIRVKRYFILCTWAGVIIFTKCISTEVFTTPSKVFTCCMYLYLSLAKWVFTISWYKYRGTRLIAHKDSYA